jgi:hypothetical protein
LSKVDVTFDKRMTWKQHITSAEAKARRKMNIMRKFAGTKWGAIETSSCFFSVNGNTPLLGPCDYLI